jgi:pimeloyl-ACP methyl ester carboxylesterase
MNPAGSPENRLRFEPVARTVHPAYPAVEKAARIRAPIGGRSGDPVMLLHGYAQTSHMFRPLTAELAKTHTKYGSKRQALR